MKAILRSGSIALVMALLLNVWPEPHRTAQAGVAQSVTPPTLQDAIQVVAGYQHTCALMADGRVKCWGTDGTGQRNIPVDVVGLPADIIAVTAGGAHACALTATGGVKCWGANDGGQLGDGTQQNHSEAVDVLGLASGVTAIAAGGRHTCAALAAGGIKCWGNNDYGQLGDGSYEDHAAPTDVFGLTGIATAIAAAGAHTCAVVSGSGVKCWGQNRDGQLGDGTTTPSNAPVSVGGLTGVAVTAIVAGGDELSGAHTCALLADGTVKCWGKNTDGQLGDGTQGYQPRPTPVAVAGLGGKVVALAAGLRHTCAQIAGQGVECWGSNQSGELGDGTDVGNRPSPAWVTALPKYVTGIAAGGYQSQAHTCALADGGAVLCWGSDQAGQLGLGVPRERAVPVDVTGLTGPVAAISAGGDHTCAVSIDGDVKCWGVNRYGQLGNGTLRQSSTPLAVVGLASQGVTAIAAGGGYVHEHTCAVTAQGGVQCWGANGFGELGNGTSGDYAPVPTQVVGLTAGVVSVVAGAWHTCALTSAGGVMCWGYNSWGQLGDGSNVDRAAPVAVPGLAANVTAITAGGNHTCAVMAGGGVKCWGANWAGQLGDGTTEGRSSPIDVPGLSGIAAITAGMRHTCALTTAGTVKCWGENEDGQLGDGTTSDRHSPTDVAHLDQRVTAIAASRGIAQGSTCALTVDGALKCWGDNSTGQLGDGTILDRSLPTDVSGLAANVIGFTLGRWHTCALVAGGRAKCWGSDVEGQLGIGTLVRQATPANVRAAAAPALLLDYTTGQTGSFFTITGWNFPPGGATPITVNGITLTAALPINERGSFIFFLNTHGALPGSYSLTANATESVSVTLLLDEGGPLHPQGGGGRTLALAGIAPVAARRTYLPVIGY